MKMPSNRQWIEAMYDRLMEGLSSEYDPRTRALIGKAFIAGLVQYPSILNELKSSSLIEGDYFDDDNTVVSISYNLRRVK
jgi:hypothetical protein